MVKEYRLKDMIFFKVTRAVIISVMGCKFYSYDGSKLQFACTLGMVTNDFR